PHADEAFPIFPRRPLPGRWRLGPRRLTRRPPRAVDHTPPLGIPTLEPVSKGGLKPPGNAAQSMVPPTTGIDVAMRRLAPKSLKLSYRRKYSGVADEWHLDLALFLKLGKLGSYPVPQV